MFKRLQKKTRKERYYYIILITGFSICYHSIAGVRIVQEITFEANDSWLLPLALIFLTLHLIFFTCLAIKWFKLLKIFIAKKKEKISKTTDGQFSSLSRFVIKWTMTLSILVCVHHYLLIIFGI